MPVDPQMVRRKLSGLLQYLWPQALQGIREQGWEPWIDRILGLLPMIGRMLGLNLSLPPQPWQESLPVAAAEFLGNLRDDQLVSLVTQARTWLDWLADPGEAGGGADAGNSAN